MTDQKTMARAIEILKEQRYYDSIQGLMGWDLWEGLSEKGQRLLHPPGPGPVEIAGDQKSGGRPAGDGPGGFCRRL